RHRPARALDLERMREVHALLQALEARAAVLVERDDLAVEQEALEGQRAERADDLRIAHREGLSLAPVELDRLTRARDEHADAVVLDLVEPLRMRERALAGRGQHHRVARERDVARGRAQARQTRAELGQPPGTVAQLLHGQAGEDRFGPALDRLVAVSE